MENANTTEPNTTTKGNERTMENVTNTEPNPVEFVEVLERGNAHILTISDHMEKTEWEVLKMLLERPYTSETDLELNNAYQQVWAARQEYKHRFDME